jgi:endonuclease/exonuclease/phosphatase family metal-dependent hydrolase
MTYNTHSCVGRDGKSVPLRIAEVIAAQGPDIVALQEIDVGLTRSGFVDQAGAIADELHMFLHFHPCLHVEQGQYGNAILSRFPMELVKAEGLPVVPSLRRDEVRGALWVEIQLDYCSVQMITTHLGLTVRERICQADILLGSQWLAHRDCMPPVIFCGDLNTLPTSRIYKSFGTVLTDTRGANKRRQLSPTWPSICPFLRLDYIFVSPLVNVRSASVIRNPLTAIASDHLPVIVEVELP